MIPHIDLLISPWFLLRITWSLHCWIALIKHCLSYTNKSLLFIIIDKLFSHFGTLLQLTVWAVHQCLHSRSEIQPGEQKRQHLLMQLMWVCGASEGDWDDVEVGLAVVEWEGDFNSRITLCSMKHLASKSQWESQWLKLKGTDWNQKGLNVVDWMCDVVDWTRDDQKTQI